MAFNYSNYSYYWYFNHSKGNIIMTMGSLHFSFRSVGRRCWLPQTNFLKYLIFRLHMRIWKKLHPAKASYPGRPRLHGKFSSKPGRISVKSTDILVKRAGSLLIKTCFSKRWTSLVSRATTIPLKHNLGIANFHFFSYIY